VSRLDNQHHFINTFGPKNIIHPSLPKDQIIRVADIATGTGIWLEDLSSVLPVVPGKETQFDGFDISDKFFPEDHLENFKFVKYNILQPFPEQYWGEYDTVHVRLLIAALKEHEIPVAVENVLQLVGMSLSKPFNW